MTRGGGTVSPRWVGPQQEDVCPPHPLQIRPWGAALADNAVAAAIASRRRGLGPFLGRLDDATLLRVFAAVDDAASLCRLAESSRFLRAFAAQEDLWRALMLQSSSSASPSAAPVRPPRRLPAASWRLAYIRRVTGADDDERDGDDDAGRAWRRRLCWSVARAQCALYSDVLYHSWRCASSAIAPRWLCGDDLPRVALAEMSVQRFRAEFDAPNRPFVLSGWAPRRGGEWPRGWLRSAVESGTRFTAGGFAYTLEEYFDYMDSITVADDDDGGDDDFVRGGDDQPLYLFDAEFARKAPQLAAAYEAPACFGEDELARRLPAALRPHWRWLIIGAARSGSSFHQDPNASSAWNALVRGRKRWLLLPPSLVHTPPGVSASADGGDVVAPLSPMEYFVNFYDEWVARSHGAAAHSGAAAAAPPPPRPYRCTQRPGEVVYVPRGWWHMVLNVEESVALTHNFVSPLALPHVRRFLRARPEQLSGVRDGVRAEELLAYLGDCADERGCGVVSSPPPSPPRSLWSRLRKRPREGGGAAPPKRPPVDGGGEKGAGGESAAVKEPPKSAAAAAPAFSFGFSV